MKKARTNIMTHVVDKKETIPWELLGLDAILVYLV